MKITELLIKERMNLDLKSKTKDDVINEIATASAKENFVIIAQNPNKIPDMSLFLFTLSCATSD